MQAEDILFLQLSAVVNALMVISGCNAGRERYWCVYSVIVVAVYTNVT